MSIQFNYKAIETYSKEHLGYLQKLLSNPSFIILEMLQSLNILYFDYHTNMNLFQIGISCNEYFTNSNYIVDSILHIEFLQGKVTFYYKDYADTLKNPTLRKFFMMISNWNIEQEDLVFYRIIPKGHKNWKVVFV